MSEFTDKLDALNRIAAKKRKEYDDAYAEYSLLKAKCKHEEPLVRKSKYTSGGYDYKSQDVQWKECPTCGAQFDKTVKLGGYE